MTIGITEAVDTPSRVYLLFCYSESHFGEKEKKDKRGGGGEEKGGVGGIRQEQWTLYSQTTTSEQAVRHFGKQHDVLQQTQQSLLGSHHTLVEVMVDDLLGILAY